MHNVYNVGFQLSQFIKAAQLSNLQVLFHYFMNGKMFTISVRQQAQLQWLATTDSILKPTVQPKYKYNQYKQQLSFLLTLFIWPKCRHHPPATEQHILAILEGFCNNPTHNDMVSLCE